MKAKITKISSGNMTIDIAVTYFDDKEFTVDRVLSLDEGDIRNFDEDKLEELIRTEGKRYVNLFEKEELLQSLLVKEIEI